MKFKIISFSVIQNYIFQQNSKLFYSIEFKIIFFNGIQNQKTALHHAVEINNIEIVKLLLQKKGIDINILDSQGKKPIDYSVNDEIRQLLSQ